MPRMDEESKELQLAKLLLCGEGKCGKTDFAAMAAALGFNVLYLDGDVAAQTIKSLPIEARQRIYLMKCGDRFDEDGGVEPTFAHFFKTWITKPTVVWNDSKQRLYSVQEDGQKNETDTFWLLRPARVDHTVVMVIEWSSLVHSAMQWAANEAGIDLGEIGPGLTDDRKEMRGLYQAAGEKLTQYLIAIQRAPCHVICITHPREFVKLIPPAGKTIGATREKDMQIAWTKMVPISSSNNHALSLSKYFTDVAWMTVGMTGKREIDFRIDNNRIGGGHFNQKFEVANRDAGDAPGSKFTFGTLVEKLGGTLPKDMPGVDHWLTIQTGYEQAPSKAAAVILKKPAAAPAGNGGTLKASETPERVQTPKGMMSLARLKSQAPAK